MGNTAETNQEFTQDIKFASLKARKIDPFDLAYAFGVRQELDQLFGPPQFSDRQYAEQDQ